MSARINFPLPLQGPSVSPVIQNIDHTIHFYEKWQTIASRVKQIALRVIGTPLILSGFFYTVPVLPIAGVLFLGVLTFLSAVRGVTSFHGEGWALLITLAFAFSKKMGRVVYSAKTAAIVLIAHAILTAPAIAVAFLSAGGEYLLSEKIHHFQNVRLHAERMEADSIYVPPPEVCPAILSTYKKTYLEGFVHGQIECLPLDLESRMGRLGWVKA